MAPTPERSEAEPTAAQPPIAADAPWFDVQVVDAQLQNALAVGAFGGFLVAQQAALRMLPRGRGTLLFTGASASLRGRPQFTAFAAAKAGLRMVSQSMAREFGPLGLHVAHLIIDGLIDGERAREVAAEQTAAKGPDGLLSPEAIAEVYWQVHSQPRSAWTQELDLRPFTEPF